MRTPPAPLPTIGEIARRLHLPVHRVEYLVRTRRIEPVGKAGNLRVFDEAAVARIAAELGITQLAEELDGGV